MTFLCRDDAVVFSNAEYRVDYVPLCLFLISSLSISHGFFEFSLFYLFSFF